MATGKCVMYKDGKPYAVLVDYGDVENQIDIWYYESRAIQPAWESLSPCPGTDGPLLPLKTRKR